MWKWGYDVAECGIFDFKCFGDPPPTRCCGARFRGGTPPPLFLQNGIRSAPSTPASCGPSPGEEPRGTPPNFRRFEWELCIKCGASFAVQGEVGGDFSPNKTNNSPFRRGRARPGHPSSRFTWRSWMAGTEPATTRKGRFAGGNPCDTNMKFAVGRRKGTSRTYSMPFPHIGSWPRTFVKPNRGHTSHP
jgi:hypothetical protein